MALWPFRRKSRRRWPRSATFSEADDTRGRKPDPTLPARSQTVPESTSAVPSARAARQLARKKTSAEPNKLQRRRRTYSFSPGRHDSIRIGRDGRARAGYQPNFSAPPPEDVHMAHYDPTQSNVSAATYVSRPPTLHNKRDGDHLMPRKKSSKKRRRNDQDREAEIKALSAFAPHRPATDDWAAGRPMRKDSKRIKTGFGFTSGSKLDWSRANRSSDISIPTHESLHSSLSSDSEFVSFRVSALDTLAPRPTLRYAVNPRWGQSSTESGHAAVRSVSQLKKLADKDPASDATLRSHRRVDDLADDLTAGDIREIMERDQRRREKKRQREREKVERKLARQAEKQREAGGDGQPQPNLERGVWGRESIGLGIDPASAVVTSSKRRASDEPPRTPGEHQHATSDHNISNQDVDVGVDPLHEFHRTTSITPEEPSVPAGQAEEPILPSPSPLPVLPPVRRESRARRFLRSKSSRSKSPSVAADGTMAESPVVVRKISGSSSIRGPLSWTSIFRWTSRSRNKRSSGPPSFSNTSRSSMQTNQLPTPGVPSLHSISTQPISIPPQKLGKGAPRRTMSRFREELPGILPISPPESRTQSPEAADPIPTTIPEASPNVDNQPEGVTFTALPQPQSTAAQATPPSARRSVEATRVTPTPTTASGPDGAVDPSPEPNSLSLASIDSEASWLSGRLGSRRRSSGIPEPAGTRSQQLHREPSLDNKSSRGQETAGEELSAINDEHSPQVGFPEHGRTGRTKDAAARWGAVKGQQPTVVQNHAANRMKSREGILRDFHDSSVENEQDEIDINDNSENDVDIDDDDSSQNDSGIDDALDDKVSRDKEEEDGRVQRAKSVNLGKQHVRNFSAGSAKLLELSPRPSTEVRRRSPDPKA